MLAAVVVTGCSPSTAFEYEPVNGEVDVVGSKADKGASSWT
jgi:hypothetical protein